MSGKRGSIPKSFRSARGLHCVSCSVGDNAGKLYVLDTSFLFLNKQAIHLRFHGTAKVQVCPIQPQGAARCKKTWSRFNITVTMQNGSQYTFKSLEKRELEPIVIFLQERGVGFQRQTARKQQQQQEEEQQEGAGPGPGTVTGEGALQPTRLVHTPCSWPQRRTQPLPAFRGQPARRDPGHPFQRKQTARKSTGGIMPGERRLAQGDGRKY